MAAPGIRTILRSHASIPLTPSPRRLRHVHQQPLDQRRRVRGVVLQIGLGGVPEDELVAHQAAAAGPLADDGDLAGVAGDGVGDGEGFVVKRGAVVFELADDAAAIPAEADTV